MCTLPHKMLCYLISPLQMFTFDLPDAITQGEFISRGDFLTQGIQLWVWLESLVQGGGGAVVKTQRVCDLDWSW